MLNLRLSPSTYTVLKEYARARGVSLAALISGMLDSITNGDTEMLPTITTNNLTLEGTNNAEHNRSPI